MRPGKKTIRESFSRAARTYDSSSGLQKDVASALAAFMKGHAPAGIRTDCLADVKGRIHLPSAEARLILDIGCGTGGLTALLSGLYPQGSVIGCDAALGMVLRALENPGCKDANLVASDCEGLPFFENTFDCVASSLTYQWTDLALSFNEAKRVLKPGGYLIFSTLGKGTLDELRNSYLDAGAGMDFLGYKDKEGISEELENTGLEVMAIDERIIIKKYENLRGLIRALKDTGAAPRVGERGKGLSAGAALRKAERIYSERFPSKGGGITATYDVIFASARKP